MFVILGQGFPLDLHPSVLQGEPTRKFFPLTMFLPIWHAEFLFAAAALFQKASEVSKIVIVSNSSGKGTDGNYEVSEEKENSR